MTKDPHSADAKVYNKLVSRAHLKNIRLLISRFDLKPEAFDVDPSMWRHSIAGGVLDCVLEEESGRLYGILGFQISSKHGRRKVLSASGSYLINYRVQGETDHSSCELFIDRVGKVAAYPYFRSLIATLAAQAGIVMAPLPIISLAPRSISSAREMEDLAPLTEQRRLASSKVE